jgi:hypothetical protein
MLREYKISIVYHIWVNITTNMRIKIKVQLTDTVINVQVSYKVKGAHSAIYYMLRTTAEII